MSSDATSEKIFQDNIIEQMINKHSFDGHQNDQQRTVLGHEIQLRNLPFTAIANSNLIPFRIITIESVVLLRLKRN